MDYSFDRMNPADLDSVLEIEKNSFTQPWTRQMFENEMRGNPFSEPVVLRTGAEIAGYCCLWFMFEECHILDFAVSLPRRRGGWGEKMLDWIIQKSRDKGARKILLEVREGNKSARALYQKAGFVEIAVRKDYYSEPRENALILMRALNG
ncbi:MAG TPA: ribosomal protein S18-alanine N-acetyltransferase [Nitrospiria bacterium]|nr:ribosomal protein S18-alanine N-acetyltransferase [Nitrospiria bacterium]